jgi:basic membrane protein A
VVDNNNGGEDMGKNAKRFGILLTFAILFGLAVCGSFAAESGKRPLKAVMLTPQKLGDDGPIDACWAGMQAGAAAFGYEIKLLEPESGEYEDSIRAMCDDGYTLVFCIFSQMQDAISRVALEYPDVKFVLVLGDLDMKNVKTLNFKDQEASFLTGIVAANLTKSGKVGVIAGAEVGDNIRNIAGFEAGVREAGRNVKYTHLYVGSFENPTKGKELANTMITNGYDMILEVCASSSMGIREAVREAGPPVCMLGNVVDESEAIPGQVPCSNFTNYRQWFYGTMEEVANGRFETGVIFQGLKEGAVDCVFASDKVMKIPQELKDLVGQYKQRIIDGDIVPPTVIQ